MLITFDHSLMAVRYASKRSVESFCADPIEMRGNLKTEKMLLGSNDHLICAYVALSEGLGFRTKPPEPTGPSYNVFFLAKAETWVEHQTVMGW